MQSSGQPPTRSKLQRLQLGLPRTAPANTSQPLDPSHGGQVWYPTVVDPPLMPVVPALSNPTISAPPSGDLPFVLGAPSNGSCHLVCLGPTDSPRGSGVHHSHGGCLRTICAARPPPTAPLWLRNSELSVLPAMAIEAVFSIPCVGSVATTDFQICLLHLGCLLLLLLHLGGLQLRLLCLGSLLFLLRPWFPGPPPPHVPGPPSLHLFHLCSTTLLDFCFLT